MIYPLGYKKPRYISGILTDVILAYKTNYLCFSFFFSFLALIAASPICTSMEDQFVYMARNSQ